MAETQTAPIALTDGALLEIRRLMQEERLNEGYGLRVGVKGGGCSGFSYLLGFDVRKDQDEVHMLGDLMILLDPAHGLYIAGMEIDYVDGLDNRGFTFRNPNATDTCGCGTSFSA